VPGVGHAELDAEQRLDLVRQLGIVRTPAVLVLDAGGREVSRGYGQPRKADVIAALGAAVAAGESHGAGEADGERGTGEAWDARDVPEAPEVPGDEEAPAPGGTRD
jgi:hypothetical protein